MKILRIADIPNTRIGGMSRAVYCTGDMLIAMGHQVEYLVTENLQVNGSASLRRRFTLPLQIPRLVHKLIQSGKQYDVVEIHEEIAAFYCLAYRLNKKLPPVVIFSHGLQKQHQLAELTYRQQKGLPVSLTLRYLRITVLQAMYGVRNCNHVLCGSSADVAYLRQIGIPQSRLTHLTLGIEPEFLTATEPLHQQSTPPSGILSVGSWILRKGILDLVPAVSRVLSCHPSIQFTVAGCGGDIDTVLAEFPETIRPQIRVIPKLINNEELITLYRQHSIFVLPSFFEGQSLVMLEAAAMGLAIVATNICGMADFIEYGINGLTVPVGDVEALAQSLDLLVRDKILAQTLGDAAKKKVQAYTWKSAADKIAKAYQQAIDDSRNSH